MFTVTVLIVESNICYLYMADHSLSTNSGRVVNSTRNSRVKLSETTGGNSYDIASNITIASKYVKPLRIYCH